jgi:beta-glucosidase
MEQGMNRPIRRAVMALATALSCTLSLPGQQASVPAASAAIDAKVEALLKQMTLEEKVGQMTQVTIDVVSRGADGRELPHALDSAKLDRALLQYHVGSILNVGEAYHTLPHWQEVITAIQDVATKKMRLRIPVLYGIDAIHGANYTKGATLFPQGFALAAGWDTSFARRIGEITALEVRASGIPWNFHPVLDIGRQPLWPRFWETYGEDVLLGSAMGVAYVRGMMGPSMSARDRIAPCLKHYAGYSYPLSGKDRTPAWIDERMMREYFLPQFEAAVKAGVPSVMVNSAEINGIPGHANYHLLTEVLKGEWNFKGFVVSDWEDIKRLHTRDRVASTPREAVRMAVMAGVDMSMVPLDFSFYDHLLALGKAGEVPMERIDDAVRRILRVKFQVGLFDAPYPDKTLAAEFASAGSTAFNREAAREVITLLKNDGKTLPLKKSARVLVTGPTADLLQVLNGGWTITWQGNREELYPKEKPTILKAIRAAVGEKNVDYVPGTTFDAPVDIRAAVAAAARADVVVACLGERPYCETPGNIDDLTLDEAQLRLVEELASAGKPVVLVLAEGRPRVIRRIVGKAQAILMAYLPGMEGGSAVADILFGDAVPCGKLSFSYPRFPNAIVPYDCKVTEVSDGNVYNPEFPFGFGLSYTTFAYSALELSADQCTATTPLTVTVTVTNTGSVAGKEIVQLYVSDLYRSVTPPVRQLKGFAKVALSPGESKQVSFTLTAEDLSFIGKENVRVSEKGGFRLAVGSLTREFELR